MSFICSGLHLAHGIPHNPDCYPTFPPTLSRQDATLSEPAYALRPKENLQAKLPNKTKVWWSEENKENVPPDDKEKGSEHHNTKEA